MWLGTSGNVIFSHDQNNPLKHFCVLLSMFCFILCVIKSCALRCNLVAAEKAQTNTHILAQVLPVVRPQLKSGVEGAVVVHQSDQYRWRAGSGGSPVWPVQMGELGWVLWWSEVTTLFQDECLFISIFLIFPWFSASVCGAPSVCFSLPVILFSCVSEGGGDQEHPSDDCSARHQREVFPLQHHWHSRWFCSPENPAVGST